MPSCSPPAGALLQHGNLTYLGFFRLPTNQHSGGPLNAGFEYGGTALCFNPANTSLFLCGHDGEQYSAEVSVPVIGGTAGMIQTLHDALEGHLNDVRPVGNTTACKVGGHFLYNGKLYVSDFMYYDGAGTQTLSEFVRPISLSTLGQVVGPTRVGPLGAGFYSGYMTAIPAAWQTLLGGPALIGNADLSIISRTSYGPAAFAFDPLSLGAATPLVYYTQAHQTLGTYGKGQDGISNPVFNGSSRVKGVVFPAGANTVLFTGRTGTGPYCYGLGGSLPTNYTVTPNQCFDPVNPQKGEHAYPYTLYVWAYDANDLAAVHAGTKQPWDVVPYASWSLTDGSGNALLGNSEFSGGAAYDPVQNLLYVSEVNAEVVGGAGLKYPHIHVYQVTLA